MVGSIDLYDYIITGKSLNEIELMDQDIIYIPPRKSTIPITGRVLNPGYYEILENENLSNLLSFAGGKAAKVFKLCLCYKNEVLNKDGLWSIKNEISNFFISKGDDVHIPTKPDFNRFVNIREDKKIPRKISI